MPTQDTTIQVPFAGALQEHIAPKLLDPPALRTAANVMWTSAGRVGKRYGSTAQTKTVFHSSGSADLTALKRIFPWGSSWGVVGTISTVARPVVASYSAQLSNLVLSAVVPNAVATRTALSALNTYNSAASNYLYHAVYSVQVGGYLVVAAGGLSVTSPSTPVMSLSIYDATTGALMVPPTTVSCTPGYSRLVACGTSVLFIYDTGAANTLGSKYIDLTNATTIATGWTTSATTLTNVSLSTSDAWSIDVMGGTGTSACFLVYRTTTASTLNVKRLDSTGTVTHTQTAVSASMDYGCAIGGSDGDTVWVTYNDASGVRAVGLSPADLTLTVAVGTVSATKCRTWCSITNEATGYARFAGCSDAGGGAATLYMRGFYNSSGSVATAGSALAYFNWRPATKLFRVDGNTYLGAVVSTGSTDPAQRGLVIIDAVVGGSYGALPVSSVAMRIHDSSTQLISKPAPVTVSGTTATAVIPVARSAQATGLDRVDLDFAAQDRWMPAEMDGATYLSAGTPVVSDGGNVAEVSFVTPPPQPAGAVTAVAGAPNGSYQYAAVYRWVDLRGRVHRSQVSLVSSTVVTGGAFRVTVTVTTQPITSKLAVAGTTAGQVWIDIYRTKALAGGDSTLYYLDSVANTTSAATVAYTDNTADSSLTVPVYTAGGVLDYQSPPSLRYLTVYRGRIFGVADDGQTLYASNVRNAGDAVSFNDLLTIAFPDGGPITALAVMDDRLFVFKRDRIYWFAGDGPAANGQGSDWGTPAALQTDAGATSPYVVTTPNGIVYRSSRGMMMLSRGLTVEYIGGAIENTIQAYPTLTSASLYVDANVEHALLTMTDSGGTSGVTIAWNHRENLWSVWDFYDADAAASSAPVTTATMVNGVWFWGVPGGRPYVLDTATYLDSGTWVTMTVTTAFFKPAGLQGYVRTKRLSVLGRCVTQAKLTVMVATDSNSFAQSHTFDEATAGVSVTGTDPLRAGLHIARQTGALFSVQLVDSAPASSVGTGQGFELDGIAWVVGVLPGVSRLPAAQRA